MMPRPGIDLLHGPVAYGLRMVLCTVRRRARPEGLPRGRRPDPLLHHAPPPQTDAPRPRGRPRRLELGSTHGTDSLEAIGDSCSRGFGPVHPRQATQATVAAIRIRKHPANNSMRPSITPRPRRTTRFNNTIKSRKSRCSGFRVRAFGAPRNDSQGFISSLLAIYRRSSSGLRAGASRLSLIQLSSFDCACCGGGSACFGSCVVHWPAAAAMVALGLAVQ